MFEFKSSLCWTYILPSSAFFGRLHPRGVYVQVEDVWSTWASEDSLMSALLSMLLFWSLSKSAPIRMLGIYLLFWILSLRNHWVQYEMYLRFWRLRLYDVWDVIFVATVYVYDDLYIFWFNDDVAPWTIVNNCWIIIWILYVGFEGVIHEFWFFCFLREIQFSTPFSIQFTSNLSHISKPLFA